MWPRGRMGEESLDHMIQWETHYIYKIKSNQMYLYSPFVHQLISQSAVQKPSLKPQTASNAGVEARSARKNSLEKYVDTSNE